MEGIEEETDSTLVVLSGQFSQYMDPIEHWKSCHSYTSCVYINDLASTFSWQMRTVQMYSYCLTNSIFPYLFETFEMKLHKYLIFASYKRAIARAISFLLSLKYLSYPCKAVSFSCQHCVAVYCVRCLLSRRVLFPSICSLHCLLAELFQTL